MRRNRHRVDSQQTDSLRIAHPDGFGVGQFDFRELHALAQNTAFLFGRPLRCEWKKLFQLIAGCLSIHVLWGSRNLAEFEKLNHRKDRSFVPIKLFMSNVISGLIGAGIIHDWRSIARF